MYTASHTSSGKRGSILIEVLISMNVIVFLIPVVCGGMALLKKPDPVYRNIQNRIQMMQCRRLVSAGQIHSLTEDQLSFNAQGKDRVLHCRNGWLLIEPGTWILCDKVRDVRFEQREEVILIHVTTFEESFTDVIAYR